MRREVTWFAVDSAGPSPNRTSPRVKPISDAVVHWWGAPPLYREADDHDAVVRFLITAREERPSSAHAVISGWPRRRVTEIVPTGDIAWHAGNWPANEVSVGYELQPFDSMTSAQQIEDTFETAAAYLALVWHRIPALRDKPLRAHSEFRATSCPGGWARLLGPLGERAAALHPFTQPERPGLLRAGAPRLPTGILPRPVGRRFLPLPVDGVWAHKSITELERALARAGLYAGVIEEDHGKDAVAGPVLWSAYQRFLATRRVDVGPPDGTFSTRSVKAEQTWLNTIGLYPFMPPDGDRGAGTIKGLQKALNAGAVKAA